jgi:hypothetical protein
MFRKAAALELVGSFRRCGWARPGDVGVGEVYRVVVLEDLCSVVFSFVQVGFVKSMDCDLEMPVLGASQQRWWLPSNERQVTARDVGTCLALGGSLLPFADHSALPELSACLPAVLFPNQRAGKKQVLAAVRPSSGPLSPIQSSDQGINQP